MTCDMCMLHVHVRVDITLHAHDMHMHMHTCVHVHVHVHAHAMCACASACGYNAPLALHAAACSWISRSVSGAGGEFGRLVLRKAEDGVAPSVAIRLLPILLNTVRTPASVSGVLWRVKSTSPSIGTVSAYRHLRYMHMHMHMRSMCAGHLRTCVCMCATHMCMCKACARCVAWYVYCSWQCAWRRSDATVRTSRVYPRAWSRR